MKKRTKFYECFRCGLRSFEYLQTYDWPGNVSELDKLLEQAINRSKGSALELPDLIDLVVK